MPHLQLQIMLPAALVIFRVIHSSYATMLSPLDSNMGHILYNSASFATHCCSVQCSSIYSSEADLRNAW